MASSVDMKTHQRSCRAATGSITFKCRIERGLVVGREEPMVGAIGCRVNYGMDSDVPISISRTAAPFRVDQWIVQAYGNRPLR